MNLQYRLHTRLAALCLILAASLLAGCASWNQNANQKQTGSMVEYLFPNNSNASMKPEESATLRLPLRVGLAFVPTSNWNASGGLPEADRMRMLSRVRDAFASQSFIAGIEMIPTPYLTPKGGFANLEQAARMFNVDVVVLLSYDQVQFADNNMFSLLYWTIVGAYVVQGDRYDISTMLDAAVFDVQSRKLLFRAPGVSQVKGSATLNNFSEQARNARLEGYAKALDALIPELDRQLVDFKTRVKSGAEKTVKVEYRAGSGGGALDAAAWLAALLLGGVACCLRRRAR